eukprot:Selendium_serpulae@DN6428_c0_g1_i2.p2
MSSRDLDAVALEKERSVRRKVLSIYSKGRRCFVNTPEYHIYVERREDMIYTLAYETNDVIKKEIQRDLNAYKAENQKEIVENEQQRENEEKDEIRRIVEEEGDFYERVKQPYINGFRHPGRELLVHPLKREFAALFSEHVPQQNATTGAPQPLSEVNYNDEYTKLSRVLSLGRDKSSKEQKRAGGWSEDPPRRRVHEEFFLGFGPTRMGITESH